MFVEAQLTSAKKLRAKGNRMTTIQRNDESQEKTNNPKLKKRIRIRRTQQIHQEKRREDLRKCVDAKTQKVFERNTSLKCL